MKKGSAMKAKLPTQRRFVQNYVTLLSGLLRLTDTELLILIQIVWELYIGKNKEEVFSPEGRAEIRKGLENQGKSMSVQNFNNYLMALKKKQAIVFENEQYDINPWLYPREEITFKYEVYEKIDKYLATGE
jgi:hypothetical protein